MSRAEVKSFQRSAESVAEFLRPRLGRGTRVKVITHTDADGISAAAIMGRCLYNYDVAFGVQFTRPRTSEDMAKLSDEGYDLYVFLDQGAGNMEEIHKHLLAKQKEVVIIDHHPGSFPTHTNLVNLNPHTCGLNGAKDVSASGATYLVVEQLDLKFRSLVGLAMVGAIGDRQEFFSGFTGVNDMLAKRAVDLELVSIGEGLKLIGRTFKPVLECLRTSTRPYIEGLSGNPPACRSLLNDLGVSPSITISELQFEQQRALADAISARAGSVASNEDFQHALWGATYTNLSDQIVGPMELREYATVLDACANLKKSEIGFAMAAGDKNTVSEALSLLSSRQEEMLRTLIWISKNKSLIKDTGKFRYIYCGEDVDSSLIGEALSLVIESGVIEMDLPLLGLADSVGGVVKISARGTPKLAMGGANLGMALGLAAKEVGGSGGGHDVAAAAKIQKDRMDEFLNELSQALTE